MDLLNEISRTLPQNIPPTYFKAGTPILTAFGCALLERETDTDYVYTAVNLKSGRNFVISRRKNPLSPSGVTAMVEKIRRSPISGASRIQADTQRGEPLTAKKLRAILDTTFRTILPSYGYTVRKEQISLAEHILATLYYRKVSLSEAEVGTGKTLAYLVPVVLAKRGHLNDFWLADSYKGMRCVDNGRMPIVVATSSIALQRALITDYIPELSRILLEHGVIRTPLTAILRKGREHYVCDRNLRGHKLFEPNPRIMAVLEKLLQPTTTIDLAEVDGLTPHVKRIISVPGRCHENCPDKDRCQYLRFRSEAQSYDIDIQIVNHNYLLADIMKRKEQNNRPLLPNYQALIIDEAHKFITAARSMYGTELSSVSLPEIKEGVFSLNFRREDARKLTRKTAKKLFDENVKLFCSLNESALPDSEDEAERLTLDISTGATKHLRNIRGDDLVVSVKSIINDAYCRDISVKTRSALNVKRDNGDYVGACPVYGYRKSEEDKNLLVIDEYPASVVRDIFRMKLEGTSAARIADALNGFGVLSPYMYKKDRGFPHPKKGYADKADAKWSATTVIRILNDETYTGTLIQGRQGTLNYKIKDLIDKPETEWKRTENAHEAIIAKRDFDLAQRIMRLDTRTAPSSDKVYLFSGILICGCCGARMTRKAVPYKGVKYHYYYCPTTKKRGCLNTPTLKETDLSECVLESVKAHISGVASVESILAGTDGQRAASALAKQYSAQIDDNRSQLEQIGGFKSSLYENMIGGIISKEDYKNLKVKYTADEERLRAAVTALTGQLDDVLAGKGERLKWTEHFRQFEELAELDRRTVTNLIQNIKVISKTELQITFSYQDEYENALALLAMEVA